jgi:hypothetical protein
MTLSFVLFYALVIFLALMAADFVIQAACEVRSLFAKRKKKGRKY